MDFPNLTKRIAEANPLDFGNIFSNTIELFKKVWVQGFLTILLTFVLLLPFYILFYLPLIAAGITDPEMLREEQPGPMLILAMVILFSLFLVGALTICVASNAAFL